ncbi:patatin [Segetibacter sp. 3557_3]|uniref:patatin-like phospholipase family protein n=1 Tax=Segetibacter sp. 3557_3 TaxID=2547429 RepID=UPI001058D292|nr:patatin-like phospholipase family protein [Segetibacter sp. 3557_3]TDH28006.1 patatin [Segetibacter sp. 3557_3]
MSLWGNLAERYEQKQPRKILALDGGGIRGIITLEFLAEMESQLREKLNRGSDFRLGEYFDYIGGTSTGAIIAAGLSIGMSVEQLLDFYKHKGKDMFDKTFILKRWKALYESGPLLNMLKETFGADTDMVVQNGKFKCLLLVVTMNRTTDSPWPISNNPLAKYNDLTRPDCNARIKLHQLVRASTAAPVFFPPETLQWDPNDPEKTFVFVDGGVTPYNNPSFLLYRMATQPAYNLNWETGENKLLIVSVGTGAAPTSGTYDNLLEAAKGLPNNLLYAMQVDQDINCRTVGRCSYGAPIDRELKYMIPMDEEGNMIEMDQDTNRQFLYVRYNADLSQEGLDTMGLHDIKSNHVREMDSVTYLNDMSLVGRTAAKEQVNLQHFGAFV